MEYQVEIPTLGKGTRLKKMVEKRLPNLNQRIFTFGEVQLVDGAVVIEFDLDEEAAAKWCLQRFFFLAGLDFASIGTGVNIAKLAKRARTRRGKFVEDNPETEANEAWKGGKAPAKKKAPAKRKRAAPKKKASAKK